MATLQIRVDDTIKSQADALFSSLGMDLSTAVRIFLSVSIENDGLPFPVRHKSISPSLCEAIRDSRNNENLYGPFNSAEAAVASMLED